MNVNCDSPRALSIQPKPFQILDLPQVVLTKGEGFFRKSAQGVEIGTSVLLRNFDKIRICVGKNYKTIVSVTYERGDNRLTSLKLCFFFSVWGPREQFTQFIGLIVNTAASILVRTNL